MTGKKMVLLGLLLAVIFTSVIIGIDKLKEPDKPKTLAQTIVAKIAESPGDWTYTEVEDTVMNEAYTILAVIDYPSSRYAFIENKKCGIRINDFGRHTGLVMVTPDTFHFSEYEGFAINDAYIQNIIKPQEEAEKRSNDSIAKIKENLIIKNLCK